MLRRLRLTNFKAFADTGPIAIRPLTLLLGPNSSGKSTIVQSLLLLKQTAESRDLTNALVTHGDYLKLGEYRDYIHGQDRGKQLGFEFTFDAMLSYARGGDYKPETAPLTISVEFAYNQKMLRPVLQSTVAEFHGATLRRFEVRRPVRGKFIAVVSEDGKEETRVTLDSVGKFYSPIFEFRLPAKRARIRVESGMISSSFAWLEIGHAVEQLFRSIYYLGPVRDEPHRLYVASGERPGDVGLKGERSVDVLWHVFRRKSSRTTALKPINEWVRRFGLAQEVTLKRVGGNNYSVTVTDTSSGLVVNLVDVGFGASQLLPLIVEGFTAPPHSTLLIEQPEIHLHPSAQSELGDLLLCLAGAEKTVIAETHSEHLLRRIQRRVAENPSLRENLAIYYCQPHADGTELKEIRLNDLGQLDPATLPTGFFEAGYAEGRALAEAMGRRALD